MDFLKYEKIPKEFICDSGIPETEWDSLWRTEEAVHSNTIFPGLYLPFYAADDLIGEMTIR